MRKSHFFKYHNLFPERGENSSWWSQLFNKTEDRTSNRFEFWKIWLLNCSILPTCGKRFPTLSISRIHLYNKWFFHFHDIQVLEMSFKFHKYLNFNKCSQSFLSDKYRLLHCIWKTMAGCLLFLAIGQEYCNQNECLHVSLGEEWTGPTGKVVCNLQLVFPHLKLQDMVDFYSWPKKLWLYIHHTSLLLYFQFSGSEMLLSVINRPPAYSGLLSSFSHFVLFTNGFAQQYPCSLFINIKVKCVGLVIKLSRKILDVRKRLYASNMSFFQLHQLFTQHITSYICYIFNPLWLYKEISTCWVNCRLQQSLQCYITFSLIHCATYIVT